MNMEYATSVKELIATLNQVASPVELINVDVALITIGAKNSAARSSESQAKKTETTAPPIKITAPVDSAEMTVSISTFWATAAAAATGAAIVVKGCSNDATLAASALAYETALPVSCCTNCS
ncbi:hypothetical protein MPRG_01640 [Mycobacterium paragordonae]|uniref:Uncharacterized protein n=1 Tax=Mycobacterium paragordonae TaxID=1389713 RepID=A0ABQ1BXJ6_9MYCO|nr:hypothetical protein MPRG_01640 [Mycobacterium paragordonae]